ncbi:hypothetical protein QOT17_005390 [Balamuthia mandrillaris]
MVEIDRERTPPCMRVCVSSAVALNKNQKELLSLRKHKGSRNDPLGVFLAYQHTGSPRREGKGTSPTTLRRDFGKVSGGGPPKGEKKKSETVRLQTYSKKKRQERERARKKRSSGLPPCFELMGPNNNHIVID